MNVPGLVVVGDFAGDDILGPVAIIGFRCVSSTGLMSPLAEVGALMIVRFMSANRVRTQRQSPMNHRALSLTAVIVALAAGARGADWPQILGPSRDGRSGETIRASFGPEGPRILWRKPIGHGLAGPAVADGKVIVFHRESAEAVVEALDVADGKRRWRTTYQTNYRDDFGMDDGPRSVPTVTGGCVFTYGAEGRLQAVGLADGRVIWQRDLAKEFESPKGWFGRCCSPLVAGDLVLVNVGGRYEGKPAGIAAFKADSGEVVWTSSDDEASYSSPIPAKLHDRDAAVFFTRKGIEVVDPRDGRLLFKAPFEPDISASVTACTPVVCGPNRIFLSACYNVGAAVWEFDSASKGREVWRESDRLDSHYATPVFLDGFLYGFHGRQEEGQVLRCVDASNGQVKWSSSALPAGSLIAAGRTLIVLTEKGELLLVTASPEKFTVLARGQILGAVARAMPAFANGTLYARDGRQIVAVDLSAGR
jgi:outer membrane protein assembly factor BamB